MLADTRQKAPKLLVVQVIAGTNSCFVSQLIYYFQVRCLQKDLPKYLSHSSMATYESCPKKFEYAKIDKIPDPPGRAMLIGTFVHAILEDLMTNDSPGRTIDQVRTIARNRWDSWFIKNKDYIGLGLDNSQAVAFRKEAWDSIEGYFAIEDPKTVQVLAVEKRVEVRFGEVSVLGFIDRLEARDDNTIVSDYKTGKVPHPNFKDGALAQPYLYAAMLEKLDTAISEYRILYLNSQTEITDKITRNNIESAEQRVHDTWGAITQDFENGNFKTKPSRLCDWCGYKQICPAWVSSR